VMSVAVAAAFLSSAFARRNSFPLARHPSRKDSSKRPFPSAIGKPGIPVRDREQRCDVEVRRLQQRGEERCSRHECVVMGHFLVTY
jgi:hypothetical protein